MFETLEYKKNRELICRSFKLKMWSIQSHISRPTTFIRGLNLTLVLLRFSMEIKHTNGFFSKTRDVYIEGIN